MEQQVHGYKRRLITPEPKNPMPHHHHHHHLNALIDSSTNTECFKPMMLNAWTQTTIDDFLPKSIAEEVPPSLLLVDELQNRIRKLEEIFKSHSITLKDSYNINHRSASNSRNSNRSSNCSNTNTTINEQKTVIKSELNLKLPKKTKQQQHHQQQHQQQTKYKIVATNSDGTNDDYTEPIVVEYADEDCNYIDQEVELNNTSCDSAQLEICLPLLPTKEEEENSGDDDVVINVGTENDIMNYFKPNEKNYQYQQQNKSKIESLYPRNLIVYPPNHDNNESVIDLTPKAHQKSQLSPTVEPVNYQINKSKTKHNMNSTTNLNDIAAVATAALSAVTAAAAGTGNHNPDSAMTTKNTMIPPSQLNNIHNLSNENANTLIALGPNNTQIPAHIYETIDWSSPNAATRKLLITIFDREILATHTMTGKPSPAFKGLNMPSKQQLNRDIVTDIIYIVSRKCGVPEKDVRNAITTKCADENKMSKQREKKRQSLSSSSSGCNKENYKNIILHNSNM